jgi:hypothetical protein
MTGDLASIAIPKPPRVLNSWEFVDAVADRLAENLRKIH